MESDYNPVVAVAEDREVHRLQTRDKGLELYQVLDPHVNS